MAGPDFSSFYTIPAKAEITPKLDPGLRLGEA